MKKRIASWRMALLLLAIAACGTQSFGSDTEIIAKSEIKRVTVFITGAQIERKASVQIPKGMSVIVFDKLDNSITASSLQASGTGNFVITDVQYRYQHPDPVEIPAIPDNIQRQIRELQDSVALIRLRVERLENLALALKQEELFIQNHPIMQGKSDPDSLELLTGASNFLRDRMRDIAQRKYVVKKEQLLMNKYLAKVLEQLTNLQNYESNQPAPEPNLPRHQVLVYVLAQTAVSAVVETTYFTSAAYWYPSYDLHAVSVGKNLSITYKAVVHQNTGVDWEGVKLKISNANPNRSKVMPELPVWYISYYRQQAETIKYITPGYTAPAEARSDDAEEDVEDKAGSKAQIAADYTTKVVNFSSVEFEIDLPYQISSDNKAHYVILKKEEVKTSFEHHLIPKMDLSAYLVGKMTDWRNLDLLLGRANIFYGGTFVGQTVIDPTVLSDTLLVSLGPDERVRSTRKTLSSSTKNKALSKKKLYTASYQIEVKNALNETIHLVLLDQIPKSKEQDIAVLVTEPDGAELLEDVAHLKWKFTLPGGQSKKVSYSFQVEYPENEKILGL